MKSTKLTCFTYGFVSIPLAFGALPLYIHIPKAYSEIGDLSLAIIGIMLWVVRLFDAFTDPYFGSLADSGKRRKLFTVAMAVFLCGFLLLSHPPVIESSGFQIILYS